MTFQILDLFAGSGGLSFGLRQAGHTVVAAVEKDRWAAETYKKNMPDVEVICADIQTLTSDFLREKFHSKIDTVVGGPPCKGFSVSGKRQYGQYIPENKLVYEYIRVVDLLRPKFFILENVRGFASATIEGRTKALNEILKKLTSKGYKIHSSTLQASDYGIPQSRSRLFVIGSLDGFGGNPFPTKCMHFTTLGEAIEDLPQINSGEGIDGPQPYAKEAVSGYAKRMRHGSSMVFNHQAMRHSQRLVTRFSTIPPGGKGYDIGRGTIHKKIVTVYKSNNQRLISELPSLCITANWQSSYIHPFLNRNLTVREAARIQSFPDTFIFTGQRACMSSNLLEREGRHSELHISQCHQVGNAVPPLLAEQIGKRLTVVDHKGDSDSDRSTLESWMVEEP